MRMYGAVKKERSSSDSGCVRNPSNSGSWRKCSTSSSLATPCGDVCIETVVSVSSGGVGGGALELRWRDEHGRRPRRHADVIAHASCFRIGVGEDEFEGVRPHSRGAVALALALARRLDVHVTESPRLGRVDTEREEGKVDHHVSEGDVLGAGVAQVAARVFDRVERARVDARRQRLEEAVRGAAAVGVVLVVLDIEELVARGHAQAVEVVQHGGARERQVRRVQVERGRALLEGSDANGIARVAS
eukprot:2503711-Pleurochrysis_carterae.AAC.1